MATVKFGICLPTFVSSGPENVSWDYLVHFAKRAEALGFDSIWAMDFLFKPDMEFRFHMLEPLTALAGLAAATQKIRLGTAVLALPFRDPVILAKIISTLDYLSKGRYIFGAGMGFVPEDFQSLGVPMKERAARAHEIIKICLKLWRESNVSFNGKFYKFENVTVEPKPRHLPLWMGLQTLPGARPEASMKRVARYAEAYITAASDDVLKQERADIEQYLKAEGRDLSSLSTVHVCWIHALRKGEEGTVPMGFIEPVYLSAAPSTAYPRTRNVTTPEKIVQNTRKFIAAGANYVMFIPYFSLDPIEQLEICAKEIIPNLV